MSLETNFKTAEFVSARLNLWLPSGLFGSSENPSCRRTGADSVWNFIWFKKFPPLDSVFCPMDLSKLSLQLQAITFESICFVSMRFEIVLNSNRDIWLEWLNLDPAFFLRWRALWKLLFLDANHWYRFHLNTMIACGGLGFCVHSDLVDNNPCSNRCQFDSDSEFGLSWLFGLPLAPFLFCSRSFRGCFIHYFGKEKQVGSTLLL
jgi:hypothetical protein